MAPLILGRRGGGWFVRIFGIKPKERADRKKILTVLIARIDTALSEIKSGVLRLRMRYNDLRKMMLSAIYRGERDRALIYANEVAEVKKMVKKLEVSAKALEQVKLRLETLENVSNIPVVLSEITGVVVATRDYVKDVMPSLAMNLDALVTEARRVITETTDVDVKTEDVIYATPEAKKLLKKLESAVEENVSKQLPDIPISLIVPPKTKVESEEKKISQLVGISIKPKIRRPVRKLSKEEIDRKVLEYIVSHGGFIDVSDAAQKLNIDKSEVLAALYRLREQNKIMF